MASITINAAMLLTTLLYTTVCIKAALCDNDFISYNFIIANCLNPVDQMIT